MVDTPALIAQMDLLLIQIRSRNKNQTPTIIDLTTRRAQRWGPAHLVLRGKRHGLDVRDVRDAALLRDQVPQTPGPPAAEDHETYAPVQGTQRRLRTHFEALR